MLLSQFMLCLLLCVHFIYTDDKNVFGPRLSPTINLNNTTSLIDFCWTDIDCLVLGKFTRASVGLTFPVNINCNHIGSLQNESIAHDAKLKRYFHIETIDLNGCGVNRMNTLGIEYIPDPMSVRQLFIEMFRIGNITAESFSKFKQLTVLHLMDNVINGIFNESFSGLNSLETLKIEGNGLKLLENGSFNSLEKLKNLTIHELTLTQLNQTIQFNNSNLQTIDFQWGHLVWPTFPESLQKLTITKTIITINKLKYATLFDRMDQLVEVNLMENNLTDSVMPKMVSYNLAILNLQKNSLKNVQEHVLHSLTDFDLSHNQIMEITAIMLRSMPKLVRFLANNNRIEKISFNAFINNPDLRQLNLTNNRLKQMYLNIVQPQVDISISENPWSCNWLTNIYVTHPFLFSNFKFTKFTEIINVKGLRCLFYENEDIPPYKQITTTELPLLSIISDSEKKRKPRDTAILTLIILVLGVAVLFFLLFLHIRCRRTAAGPQPFYRTLPYTTQRPGMVHGTDIVRRILPATDYEEPIECRRRLSTTATAEFEFRDFKDLYEEIPERKHVVPATVNLVLDSKSDVEAFVSNLFESAGVKRPK